MPNATDLLLLNTTKASLAYLLPTHDIQELPATTNLDKLGIEATLHRRLLTRCAIALSNTKLGAVRSVWLHQNVAYVPGQTISQFASALGTALGSTNSAFHKCPDPPSLDNPSAGQCTGWKQGSVACRCGLAIEDWADPAALNQPITGGRQLGSFHGAWNLGILAQLVEATNDRQVFAPFFHERMAFPNSLPPATTTVKQWLQLVLQLRTPKTKCP